MKPIDVGMAVTWTNQSQNGRVVSMQVKDGTVLSITDDMAIVKTKRGKRQYQISVSALRPAGEPSTLDEFLGQRRAS